MLDMPCREVQQSALHGVGHDGRYLERQAAIDQRIERFIAEKNSDTELVNYARAAARGMVQ
jgi:hypothetical protein